MLADEQEEADLLITSLLLLCKQQPMLMSTRQRSKDIFRYWSRKRKSWQKIFMENLEI
jgi:hypothetical protein